MIGKHVLITTEFRGVFMGKLVEQNGTTATLEDARNCVFWSAETRGVFGLASHGPGAGCRIGRAVPKLMLKSVASVTECTPEAVKAWEAEPWAR